jgi:hypothetical protein
MCPPQKGAWRPFWRGRQDICTNLTDITHLVPYPPPSLFAFKAFRYVPVIFKYPQPRIGLQIQINERRFRPYTTVGIRSGYRGNKEAFAMKASINNAAIILPFSRASDATGFFLGKPPKPGTAFSLLKYIPACRRRRYVSRTSSGVTEFGSDVTATIYPLNEPPRPEGRGIS